MLCACVLLCHTALVVKGVLLLRESVPRGLVAVAYNLAMMGCVYANALWKTTIASLLFALLASALNALVMLAFAGYEFLITYKREHMASTLLHELPALLSLAASLLFCVFALVVRRYMIIGLVVPMKLLRERGIEGQVELVRKEYAGFFA